MRRARMRRLLAEKKALTPGIAMAEPGSPFAWYHVPYLHSVLEPDHAYAHGAITTDRLGLRRVDIGGRMLGLREFQQLPGKKCLLVGGSTAFSMGATSDAASIASNLSRRTGDAWFHLAVVCYVSTQEFLLYSLTAPEGIGEIVLLSGLNTLSAVALSQSRFAPEVFAPNFFVAPGRPVSTRQKAAEALRRAAARFINAPMRRRLPAEVTPERLELALGIIRRDLRLWRDVASARGIRLTYAAQPLLSLLGKPLSPEEARIVEIQRELGAYDAFTLWGFYLEELPRVYPAYCAGIGRICAELGIAFHDLNAQREAFATPEWLFADPIHFTDRGNEVCAELIARLTSARDAHAALAG